MSFWNYRIVRVTYDGEVAFEIRECHYADDQRDVHPPIPHSVSTVAASVSSESSADVRGVLTMMVRACDLPVVDYASFAHRS